MRPELQAMLSGGLTFGVPLVLALRELAQLRRGSGGGWRPERPPEDIKPRPLPPSLLSAFEPQPKLHEPAVTRTLEPV